MKIAVLITTHNRPQMLLQMLHGIQKMKGDHQVVTFVITDGPQENYDQVFQYAHLHPLDVVSYTYPEHCGKRFYCKLINRLYNMVRNFDYGYQFDYFIQIPDDIGLCDNFFNEAVSQFDAIQDSKTICLNLLNDGREQPGWTGFKHEEKTFGNNKYLKTQWVDMCFIAKRDYFDALQWNIQNVNLSWSGDEKRSSGVGLQISQRLNDFGRSMYLVSRSLVSHGGHVSQMHPNHRKEVPLISVTEKVIAGMATIIGRIESLKESIASLLPQVDKLYIRLNGYTSIPDCCKHHKIIASIDVENSLGDAGKFLNLHESGFLFFCDDDLIYPPDYVKQFITAIESNNRKAIITIHGREFRNFPVHSYYHDNSNKISCLNTQLFEQYLHVPGTGVTAFHSSTIKLSLADFKRSNMADIWLGIAAQKNKVPIIAIAHRKGWIRMSRNYDESHSIYSMVNRKDAYQTDMVNSIKWTLNTLKNEQSKSMA